jgi:hypothetical protein
MAGLYDDTEAGAYTDPSPGIIEDDPKEIERRKREAEARPLLTKAKRAQKVRGTGILNQGEYTDPISTGGMYTDPLNDVDYSLPVPTNEPLYRDPAVDELTGSLTQPEDEMGWGMKTLDFLFGAEGAVVGIEHDADGWSWNMENMKQQWSEAPLWSNLLSSASLIGTIAVPAGLAVKSSMKMGMLAGKAGRAAFEVGEVAKWNEIGLIDKAIKSTVTHESMGPKTVKRMRILAQAKEKQIKRLGRADTAKAVAAGEEGVTMSRIDKAKYAFEKRFANTYNDVVNSASHLTDSPRARFARALDSALDDGTVGQLLEAMPTDQKQFIPISAYMMSKLNKNVATQAAGHLKKLTPESKKWADFLMEASIKKQKARLDDGFIDQKTFDTIGEFHMAMVDIGTEGIEGARSILVPIRGKPTSKTLGLVEEQVPRTGLGKLMTGGGTKTVVKAADELSYVPISVQARPKLGGPTMMHRASTQEELYERMVAGRVISDPADVLSKGYLTDELLHTNFKVVRDISIDPNLSTSAAEGAAMGAKKMKALGFVSLEGEGLLGQGGAAALRRMIAKKTGADEAALPWIRKEIFDDVFGVDGMFEQTSHVAANMMDVGTTIYKTAKTAGNIPTHLQNITGNLSFLAQAGFNPLDPENIALMSGLHKSFVKLAEISAVSREAAKGAGKGARAAFDEAGKLKKINFGTIKYKGKTLNLNDELTDPIIKELIEDSAFHSAEGAGNMGNIAQSLATDQHATKALIEGINKGRKFVQGGDRFKWWEGMTRTYLEEDMLPKMAYYLSLRGDGFSKVAAATEVARRLPMYNTVGSTIKKGRKFWLPWATFPAEAMRITKNNIQDYPLRMMPWLRAPQIMQSMASGMGVAPDTRAGVAEAERQLPWWAQKNTTVLTEGDFAAQAGGAATGAVVGGFAGGFAGPKGAVAGMAAGAAIGGIAASLATDEEHEKQLRGSLMDWLPHSTTFLASTSADWAGEGLLPAQSFQGLIEQMPAEPLAILKPMIDAISGEDAFGNPVGDGTVHNGIAKAIAGTIGLLAPPVIQKYGFQTRMPDVPATVDPFGITNIARLKVEGGSLIPFMDPAMDPMTGMVGSLGHDFFLNNMGVFKSYMASGEQQLTNETITERHMGDVRNKLSKNLAFHLENGNDKEVVGLLSEVQSTFSKQFAADPRKASAKYTEWLERRKDQIGRHPKLRNWSEEELATRIQQAGYAQGEARSAARNSLLQALRDEQAVRGISDGGDGGGGMLSSNALGGDGLSSDLSSDVL